MSPPIQQLGTNDRAPYPGGTIVTIEINQEQPEPPKEKVETTETTETETETTETTEVTEKPADADEDE